MSRRTLRESGRVVSALRVGAMIAAAAAGACPARAAPEGYFSLQGEAAGGASTFPVLGLRASAGGTLTAETFHSAGGMNAAGQTIAPGSFDPTLTLRLGAAQVAFDDNSGAGNDARLVAAVAAGSNYTLTLGAVPANATGRYAVDVVGPSVQTLSLAGGADGVESVVIGGRNGGGAVLDFGAATDLLGLAVKLNAGGTMDVRGAAVRVRQVTGVGTVRMSGVGASLRIDSMESGDANFSEFAGSITGTGRLVVADNAGLTLTGASTFTGNVDVESALLAIGSDASLGSAATPQTITLTFGAVLAGAAGFNSPVTLSANRRVVIGEDGASLEGIRLDASGQLSGREAVSLRGVRLGGANAGLSGDVTVDEAPTTAAAAGALGSGAVTVVGTTLTLSAGGAAGNDVTVTSALNEDDDRFVGGVLAYAANGALGGHTATTAGPRLNGSDGSSTVDIKANVTSVGGDRFVIGSDHLLQVRSTTAGLLTRGANLILADGAGVQLAADGSVANLGTANDLFYVRDPNRAGPVSATVGVAGGTTPWRGVRSGPPGQTGPLNMTLSAAGDFLLDASDLYGIDLRGSSIVTAAPAKAIVTAGFVEVGGAGNFANVTFSVEDQAVLKSYGGGADLASAAGVNVNAGGRLEVNPGTTTVRQLTGTGDVTFVGMDNDFVELKVGGAAASAFAGRITDEFDSAFSDGDVMGGLTKIGTARFTLSGTANSYRGPTLVSQGTLAVGADNALPQTSGVTVAAGATLDLAGHADRIGLLTGAGSVLLGGGSLTVDGGDAEGTFSGSISGSGSVTKAGGGELVIDKANAFVGPLTVRDGPLRFRGAGAAPGATAVSIYPGGVLHLDSRSAAGGNHPANDRLPNGAPVALYGGGLLLTGVDGAATSEAVGSLSALAGASAVAAEIGDGGTVALSFASLGPRGVGATVNFSGADSLGGDSKILIGGGQGAFIGGWAVAEGVDFAKYDPAKGVVPFALSDYKSNQATNDAHLRLSTPTTALTGNTVERTIKLDAGTNAVAVTQAASTRIDVTAGGILKTGSKAASIGPAAGAGTSPFVTSSFGDLIFHVNEGDLTVTSRPGGDDAASRAFALTKSGDGRLILAGGNGTGSTYAGKTYVNQGTLLLQKAFTNNAAQTQVAIPGDVDINGGRLELGAGHQIADTALVTLNAGSFALGGFDETIRNIVVNGGTFESGSGVLTLTEATFNGGTSVIGTFDENAGAAVPAARNSSARGGAAPALAAAGTPVVSTASKVTVVDGVNSVETNSLLVVGASGLTFKGGRTPSIRLAGATGTSAAGRLQLNGDVFVTDAGTRASITGDGVVDLNGARVITPDPQTSLGISARVSNGQFEKTGAGTLRLSGPTFLTGAVRVTGGTLEFATLEALDGANVSLEGGSVTLRPALDEGTHAGAANGNLALKADGVLIADEARPDPERPGQIALNALSTGVKASRLTVSSPNAVAVEFSAVNLGVAVTLDVSTTLRVLGPVAGGGAAAVTKDGRGRVVLGGEGANAYGGLTVVQGGGAVDLAKDSGVVAIPGNLQVKGAGSVVRILAAEQIADASNVTVTAGAILDLNGLVETVASVGVDGGGQVVTGGGTLVANSISITTGGRIGVRAAGLGGGAAAAPGAGHVPVGDGLLATKALAMTAGTLDVGNNSMVVDYDAAAASPVQTIRQRILAGYAGGAWTGAGITSSVAAADPGAAVGYGEAKDLLDFGGAATSPFMGRDVDKSAIIVRYTLAADATLDGVVDFNDLVKLAQNYNVADGQRTWTGGDFTYDGNVDFNDLVKLAQNYNTGLPAAGAVPGASAAFEADLAAAFAAVPEPSGAGTLAVMGAVLAGRRRRRLEGRARAVIGYVGARAKHGAMAFIRVDADERRRVSPRGG